MGHCISHISSRIVYSDTSKCWFSLQKHWLTSPAREANQSNSFVPACPLVAYVDVRSFTFYFFKNEGYFHYVGALLIRFYFNAEMATVPYNNCSLLNLIDLKAPTLVGNLCYTEVRRGCVLPYFCYYYYYIIEKNQSIVLFSYITNDLIHTSWKKKS